MDSKPRFILVDEIGNVDDASLDVHAFVLCNDLPDSERERIEAMKVGERIAYSGGAAPLMFVERES